ncbi:MAG: TOBE domain-containing protein [Alcaligenaceae bacterium]|nr:TOBE domain-containing protein [Alcaligenaceae bacterium]
MSQHSAPFSGSEAIAYIRPHDIEISRDAANALGQGQIEHIHSIGPIVRVEIARDGHDENIEVVLSKERYRSLGLMPGDSVYVKARKVAVFDPASV